MAVQVWLLVCEQLLSLQKKILHDPLCQAEGEGFLFVWGGKHFWILQKACIVIWAVQQELRHMWIMFMWVLNIHIYIYIYNCQPIVTYIGRNFSYSSKETKYLHLVTGITIMLLLRRKAWIAFADEVFPSWELCEDNREKTALEDLALDPPSMRSLLTGMWH